MFFHPHPCYQQAAVAIMFLSLLLAVLPTKLETGDHSLAARERRHPSKHGVCLGVKPQRLQLHVEVRGQVEFGQVFILGGVSHRCREHHHYVRHCLDVGQVRVGQRVVKLRHQSGQQLQQIEAGNNIYTSGV